MRARVSDILKAAGKPAFVESCLWADQIRNKQPETNAYHFINLPRDADGVVIDRDCPLPASCVVREVEFRAERLKHRPSRDDLRFLVHFVGDLHQPLHVSYGDDAGGTLIKGKFLGADTTLHGLWDFGLLEAAGRPWQDIAATLEAEITPEERRRWDSGDALTWANETFALARAPVVAYYPAAAPFNFGKAYFTANLPTVYGQLQKAGVRLAYELEKNLL